MSRKADLRFDCGHCGASHDLEEVRRRLFYNGFPVGDYHATAASGTRRTASLIARWKIGRAIWGKPIGRLSARLSLRHDVRAGLPSPAWKRFHFTVLAE